MTSTNRVFKRTYVAGAIVALLAAAFVPAAIAGTATANLSVTATIANNCTISTAPVAFGTYDPIVTNASTAASGTGTITTTCTTGDATTLTLGQGANAGSGSTAAAPVRRMANGTNYLSYGLYTNSGHTTVFDGVTGEAVTGTGAAVATTVYGTIAAAQNLPAGSYSDTVVATVTF